MDPVDLAPPPHSDHSVTPVPPRRRRNWLIAAALVVVVAAGGTAYAVTRSPGLANAKDMGVGFIRGHTYYKPDGTVETLRLPGGVRVEHAYRVPAGLVLDTATSTGDASDALYLVAPGGQPSEIAQGYNSPIHLTGDGRAAVLDWMSSPGVDAYDFATARHVSHTETGTVTAVGGDWAVLADPGSDPTTYRLWNVRVFGATGTFPSDQHVVPLAVSTDVTVLEVTYQRFDARPDLPQPMCVALVSVNAITGIVPATGPGYCGTRAPLSASLSPDGRYAVVTMASGFGVISLADLRAGRWRLRPFDDDVSPTPAAPWDSAGSVILTTGSRGGYQELDRCTVDGHCHGLGRLLGDDVLVFPAGG